MLYAILCYHNEDVVGSWSKEQDAAVMDKLAVVQDKLRKQGRLGPVARLLPTTAATTLRNAKTATFNDWSAILYAGGNFYQSMMRENLEIYDRVGGGDGFASGLAYGFLEGKGPQAAVEYGAAHGALAMTTPGDTSMVNVKEVEAVMKGKGARVIR